MHFIYLFIYLYYTLKFFRVKREELQKSKRPYSLGQCSISDNKSIVYRSSFQLKYFCLSIQGHQNVLQNWINFDEIFLLGNTAVAAKFNTLQHKIFG